MRDHVTGELVGNHDTIPLGKKVGDRYIFYNNWVFVITTQPIPDSDEFYIVGFDVEPRSYAPGEHATVEYEDHVMLDLGDL